MRRILGVLLGCLLAAAAMAHDPGLSGIRLIVRRSDTVVSVSLHRSKLQAVEAKGQKMSSEDVDKAIRRRLHVRIDGRDFLPTQAHVIDDPANDLVSWQSVEPHPGTTFEVGARLLSEEANSRTLVTVSREGQVVKDVLLDDAHPSWLLTQAPVSGLEVSGPLLVQGVEHILSGPDHILFVLGLILLGGTLRSLVKTVTAFTIAHSITLTLAATGVFHPSSQIVEPLIALSIVAIAIENLRPRPNAVPPRDFRPYVAFLFGLVHGFGFAGALSDVGLHGLALGLALAMFNVGVECGQAAIILVSAPLIAWASRLRPATWPRLADAGSVAIGIIGGYWFATRLLGG